MRVQRGYTIVEIIIVLAIMLVLLVLGVVTLNNAQRSSRDTARTTTVETVARSLESFYNGDAAGTSGEQGHRYPSAEQFLSSLDGTAIRHILPGLSEDSYQYPSRSGQQALFVQSPSNGISKDSATVDRFVYEPRARDGSLCVTTSQECSRFFLYYRLERAPTVTITITSNHQ